MSREKAMASYSRGLSSIDVQILCDSPLHKKNRSHFEIIALILKSLTSRSVSPYLIMRHTNVNHTQLKKYLRFLVEMGMVEIELGGNQILYRSGEKGLAFLRQYYVLQEILLGRDQRKLENTEDIPTITVGTHFTRH